MLEDDHAGRSAVGELLKQIRCDIELPPSAEDFFEVADASPPTSDDKRRFARRAIRSVAALEHGQTFSFLPRAPQWHKVFTKDVSRGGLAFLHSQQLYPRERMRMLLPDPRIAQMLPRRQQSWIEVARCRRLGPHCYEIGAMFVDDSARCP